MLRRTHALKTRFWLAPHTWLLRRNEPKKLQGRTTKHIRRDTPPQQRIILAMKSNSSYQRNSAQSDEALLEEYRDYGTQEAFEELFARYAGDLLRYLYFYLQNHSLAEDALQGAFFQVHRKCEQFQSGRSFRPWLYKIAKNHAGDLLRKNKRHRAVSLSSHMDEKEASVDGSWDIADLDATNPAIEAESREQYRNAIGVITQLQAHHRAVVDQVVIRGLRYGEVAVRLGVPVGTVKSRMHTAMRNVRASFPDSKLRVSSKLKLVKGS